MPRYRMTVAYDGTDFHGWQKQFRPDNDPLRTVQGVLEQITIEVMREPLVLMGASRTDSGVHAKGQIAAFTANKSIDPERLLCALNSRLPDDIQIKNVDMVDEQFDPISDCTNKNYRYQIAHGCSNPRRKPLLDRHTFAVIAKELNVAEMQKATIHFLGEHDFIGFTKNNHGRESTIRTVEKCRVIELGEWRVAIDVCGRGFLWNMVRIIAGTLVEVGIGRVDADNISNIIKSGNRQLAGKTMPPQGLSLEWIHYD